MWYINTMASAEEDDGNILKFYFYTRDVRTNCFFCVELHVDKNEHTVNLSIKAKEEKAAMNLKKYIFDLLSLNELIAS